MWNFHEGINLRRETQYRWIHLNPVGDNFGFENLESAIQRNKFITTDNRALKF